MWSVFLYIKFKVRRRNNLDNNIQYHYYSEQKFAVITINRHEKRNAISLDMAVRLLQCIKKAKQESLKFLVLTANGDKMFCAGGDLHDLHGELSTYEAEQRLLKMMEVLYEITIFPVPTIALLNGDAVGGGCELATACDIRIAKSGTKFGFVQTNLGIIPGWGGGVLLAKRVHPSFSNQWIMEGTLYEAEELLLKGWIHRIVQEEDWTNQDKLLTYYTTKSLEQMKILKKHYLQDIGVVGLKDKMKREVRDCATLWESNEHKLAVRAFLEKR